MDRFGQKVRQSRLSRYGIVKRRDDDYVGGQKGVGDAVARENKTGKTKEEVFG